MIGSRYDASDNGSLYPQTMTRASSRTDTTEPLYTPMDELPNRSSKAGIIGPRSMSTRKPSLDAVHVHSGISGTVLDNHADRRLEIVREQHEYDPEPYGPYFSLPRDPTSGAITLQHRPSAKLLISRYESMSAKSEPRSVHPSSRASSASPMKRTTHQPPLSSKKEKGNSPLRRSFRNFLSVFKKGKGSGSKEIPSIPSTRYITGAPPNASPGQRFDSSHTLSHGPEHCNAASSLPAPAPIFTGPLLYLSQSSPPPSGSPMLPVWTTCTVALEYDRILITWLTTHGNPSTHTISLMACADVRSLALSEITQNERALIPRRGDAEELKVFEIQFEGKPREKFAATSVQERAKWVSAIWDAILQSHDRKGTHHMEPQVPPKPFTIITDFENNGQITYDLVSPAKNTSDTLRTLSPAEASTYDPDRALPPTPRATMSPLSSPQRITLRDSPRPRFLTTPDGSITSLSPASSMSRSKSPSIVNLGNRSVVKQRLAQIERTYSIKSSTDQVCAMSRQTTDLTTSSSVSSRSERLRAAFLNIETLQRQGSFRTDDGDLGDNEIQSPISARTETSFCLTSVKGSPPMRLASATLQPSSIDQSWPTTKMRRASKDHTAQVFSPASCYTTGTEAVPDSHSTPTQNIAAHKAGLSTPPTFGQQEVLSILPPTRVSADQGTSIPVGNIFGALEIMAEAIDQITEQGGGAEKDLKCIQEKLEDIKKELRCPTPDNSGIVNALHEMQVHLNDDLPTILKKLEEIRLASGSSPSASEMSSTVLKNLKPSFPADESTDPMTASETISPRLLEIDQKIDGLVILCQSAAALERTSSSAPNGNNDQLSNEVTEVLSLLKNYEGHRISQADQQADSVRYLNELNSWLESFVNNGTSQIQGVAISVQRLCKDLGCGVDRQLNPGDASSIDEDTTLLDHIRQLAAAGKERDQDAAALRHSVEGLVNVVNENLRQTAEARNAFATGTVTELIEQQRQDQENMLKALATELSNDIRGERLRFVDAMKEATAINVQAHVEQFKKELTREVLFMTQEVGRLHRERQVMEQQIADLFAFYSKQKQAAAPTHRRSQPPAAATDDHVQPPVVPHARSSSTRRPLPIPSHPY